MISYKESTLNLVTDNIWHLSTMGGLELIETKERLFLRTFIKPDIQIDKSEIDEKP